MKQEILTVKEAATLMRISPSAMYQLIRENKAPHISIGKRKVIPAAQFYEWINRSVTGGSSNERDCNEKA